jgi:hypothetical protein
VNDTYILGIMAGAIIIHLVFFVRSLLNVRRDALSALESRFTPLVSRARVIFAPGKDEERAREEAKAYSMVYYQSFRCLNCGSESCVYIPKGVYKEDVGPFPCQSCGCLQKYRKAESLEINGPRNGPGAGKVDQIRAITLEEEEPQ